MQEKGLIESKENRLIKYLRQNNTYRALLRLEEELNISLDDAYIFYTEKIGEMESIEKSRARLKQAAQTLPIAGYIDEDGATILPASWRD